MMTFGIFACTLLQGVAAAGSPASVYGDSEIFGVLQPFWEGQRMVAESVLFLQGDNGERPSARLLFTPEEVQFVVLARFGTVYEAGRDYEIDRENKRITLPEGSRIPFWTESKMNPPKGASGQPHISGEHDVFFSEGHVFHDMQVEVTYTHRGGEWQSWGAYVPQPQGSQLEHVMGLLEDRQPVKLVLLGDSISAGANASGAIGVEPFMPSYGPLVAQGLQQRDGSEVSFSNLSKGGMTSEWGASVADQVADEVPDLVIIAFGMNDASARIPATDYISNINKIMDTVRERVPEAEFVLVATMTANPEWINYRPEFYTAYEQALENLTEPGVVMADMTAVWRTLLQHKKFADITGNGVNHPNDFGHRVYAETILALIRPE